MKNLLRFDQPKIVDNFEQILARYNYPEVAMWKSIVVVLKADFMNSNDYSEKLNCYQDITFISALIAHNNNIMNAAQEFLIYVKLEEKYGPKDFKDTLNKMRLAI